MLEVEDLSKSYGGTVALDSASLAFTPGAIHAILGENGSGKSTLVKLLSGVVPPSRGVIRIDGRPIERFSPRIFRLSALRQSFRKCSLLQIEAPRTISFWVATG